MVQNKEKYEKSLIIKMSEQEHRQIKLLATNQGKTIKDFLFSLLDEKYPNWRSDNN